MSSRNQKATALVVGLFIISAALSIFGALVKPETRITGTIAGHKIDIPAWLQTEPEYDGKLKNVKVEQGWGWARFLFFLLALAPAGLAIALIGERRAELGPERKAYEDGEKEKEDLRKVRSAYKVGLTATILKKTGEAKIALHEDALEEKVDSIRAANGWFAPEPVIPQLPPEPPVLRQPEGAGGIFEGMKTPAQYAEEIEAARLAAIAKLAQNDGDPRSVIEMPRDPKFAAWEAVGMEIMDSLASMRISILSAGPTGSGKTHTMDKWLRDIRVLFPKAEIWAIAQKADPFCGLLNEGRVQVFQDFSMEASLRYLDKVYAILQERRKTPKHKRAKLYDDHPIRLILDDWFSIYQALLNDPIIWKNAKQKISSIITVGREFNVCLYVCTQSYNLEALGIADDGNIRANLAILCQCFVKLGTDANGKKTKQGAFQTMLQLLKNQSIIPDKEDRDRLLTELRLMMVLSKQYQRPVIFSAIDDPTLGFPPHIEIEGAEDEELEIDESASTNVAVADRNSGDDEDADGVDWTAAFSQELTRRGVSGDTGSDLDGAGGSGGSDKGDNFDISDTGSACDDDSTSDTADHQIYHDNADKNDNQGESPDYEDADLEYLKWLPKESKLIEIMESTAPGFSLSNLVRSKLKVTSSENSKRAKRAIMALVKKLNRADLWEKFGMSDINI